MQQNLAVAINAIIIGFNSFVFALCMLILILYLVCHSLLSLSLIPLLTG